LLITRQSFGIRDYLFENKGKKFLKKRLYGPKWNKRKTDNGNYDIVGKIKKRTTVQVVIEQPSPLAYLRDGYQSKTLSA